jgi:poly(A) polymerase
MKISKIFENFRKSSIFKLYKSFENIEEKFYIVGGSLRNFALNQDSYDLDIVLIDGEPEKISKEIAKKIKGFYFLLDEEFKEYRILLKREKNYTIDVSPLRGENIEEDLKKRDLTINSIALDPKKMELIDIVGGLKDIEEGILRTLSEENLIEDPLRILRVIRFHFLFGFKIEEKTYEWMKKNKELLKNVAKERIKYEIWEMFGKGKYIESGINILRESEIVFEIIPLLKYQENSFQIYEGRSMNILEHTLNVVKNIGKLERNIKKTFFSNFKEEYYKEWFSYEKKPLLFLSGFFHDIAKPFTVKAQDGKTKFYGHDKEGAKIASKWGYEMRLSKKESKILHDLVYNHMYPHLLGKEKEITKRALFRYLRKTGEIWFALFLLDYADFRATPPGKNPKYLKELLEKLVSFYEEQKKERPKPLITGYDLIDLGLTPGPIFKKILQDVEEKRAEKIINTKEEAIEYVKKNYLK